MPFSFKSHSIRAINKNGDIWFVAVDVCNVLDIKNPSDAIKSLDEDEYTSFNLGYSENRGNPNVNIINESGLYALILRSRKPEAKKFRKWVTSEVLPSIRKTGGYIHSPAMRPAMTKEQKYLLKKKIDEITRGSDYSTHCQNVYNHLRVAFQVARVDDIPQDYFDAAMSLIEQKREASFQFYTFLREIKDWYAKNVLGGGHPWTPHIKRELTKKLKRQVILPPKVDWLALAEEVKKRID